MQPRATMFCCDLWILFSRNVQLIQNGGNANMFQETRETHMHLSIDFMNLWSYFFIVAPLYTILLFIHLYFTLKTPSRMDQHKYSPITHFVFGCCCCWCDDDDDIRWWMHTLVFTFFYISASSSFFNYYAEAEIALRLSLLFLFFHHGTSDMLWMGLGWWRWRWYRWRWGNVFG